MGKRKSSAQIEARAKARELQAQYDVLAGRREEIATQAVLLQSNLSDFDAETEQLLSQLQAKRDDKRAEMLAQLGSLAVKMINTKVSRAEAAGRLGLSVAELNAARKAFDDALQARAEESASSSPAPDTTSVDGGSPPVSVPGQSLGIGLAGAAGPAAGSPPLS